MLTGYSSFSYNMAKENDKRLNGYELVKSGNGVRSENSIWRSFIIGKTATVGSKEISFCLLYPVL